MLVKVKLVSGATEFFETEKYMIGKPEETHPDILEFTVYSARGKKLAHWKRPHQKFYVRYEYKPLQQELKPAEEKNA